MIRVVLRQLLVLVVSVILALLLVGVVLLIQGRPADRAFLVDAPDVIFVFMDIGLVVFMVLLIIGGVRRQGLGWGLIGTSLATLVGALANLLVITVLVLRTEPVDVVAIGLGALAGSAFVASTILAAFLADRLIPPSAAARRATSTDE